MKAVYQNPGWIVRRPRNHQRLHDCIAMNQYVIFICSHMHVYASICIHMYYMQALTLYAILYAFFYMHKYVHTINMYAKICTKYAKIWTHPHINVKYNNNAII